MYFTMYPIGGTFQSSITSFAKTAELQVLQSDILEQSLFILSLYETHSIKKIQSTNVNGILIHYPITLKFTLETGKSLFNHTSLHKIVFVCNYELAIAFLLKTIYLREQSHHCSYAKGCHIFFKRKCNTNYNNSQQCFGHESHKECETIQHHKQLFQYHTPSNPHTNAHQCHELTPSS